METKGTRHVVGSKSLGALSWRRSLGVAIVAVVAAVVSPRAANSQWVEGTFDVIGFGSGSSAYFTDTLSQVFPSSPQYEADNWHEFVNSVTVSNNGTYSYFGFLDGNEDAPTGVSNAAPTPGWYQVYPSFYVIYDDVTIGTQFNDPSWGTQGLTDVSGDSFVYLGGGDATFGVQGGVQLAAGGGRFKLFWQID